MRTATVPLLALLVLASAPASADEDESPGELAPGDTAFGQDAGELEVAFETTWTSGAEEEELEVRLALEYGITDRVQVGLEVPYLFVDPDDPEEPSEDGFDLGQLSWQFGLLGEDAPIALSLATEIGFPIAGRDGPGSDDVEMAAAILAAWVEGSTEIFGGVKSTWSDSPTEIEAELGVVFVKGRVATELQVTWTDAEEDTWEVQPELIIEDIGPFDLGIAFPYTFLDGRDEWGVGLTLTHGWP